MIAGRGRKTRVNQNIKEFLLFETTCLMKKSGSGMRKSGFGKDGKKVTQTGGALLDQT